MSVLSPNPRSSSGPERRPVPGAGRRFAVRPALVDSRGPRFAAWITTVVVAVGLLTESGWVFVAQAVIFGLGAFVGLGVAPYSVLYRLLVAPRLGPPPFREAAAPVRFAQGVGFVFAVAAAAGYLLGAPLVGTVAASGALLAAFLNAAFGVCLGCMLYLRGQLLVHRFHRGTTPA